MKYTLYDENFVFEAKPEDVRFLSRSFCEAIINRMDQIIKGNVRYRKPNGTVTLGEFFALAMVNYDDPNELGKDRSGWTDLSGARILRDRNGFYIKFPELEELK